MRRNGVDIGQRRFRAIENLQTRWRNWDAPGALYNPNLGFWNQVKIQEYFTF